MKYLLAIYEDEKRWANLEKNAMQAELSEYFAFGDKHRSAILGGNALKPTSAATTVRVRDGQRLVTDGPFAETKEQLGGFYLVEAPDLDEALKMAAQIPAARYGSIEVRPIQTFQ